MKMVLRSQKGSSLAMVLILFTVLIILGFSAMMISGSQLKLGSVYTHRVASLHIAEAGVNHYLWHLNKVNATPIAQNIAHAFENGQYMIEVVAATDSYHHIKSTGWSNREPDTKRTIEVKITKRTFAYFSYFTISEGTAETWWTTADVVYGPFHVNDVFRIWENPTFHGPVTHSGNIRYRHGLTYSTYPGSIGANAPRFLYPVAGENIKKVAAEVLPSSNEVLRDEAIASISPDDNENFLYKGSTRIFIVDDSVIVRNSLRHGTNAVTRKLPENAVIYVENDAPPSGNKFHLSRGHVFVSGQLSGHLTIGAEDNIYITGKNPTVAYNNLNNFNSAPWNINANTGGIRYKDTTFTMNSSNTGFETTNNEKDMLGLIANNDIWIHTHGWWGINETENTSPPNFLVHGALFAINGRIGNESLASGTSARPSTRGTATVRGSLVAQSRSTMAVIGAGGYNKNYAHDPRMLYMSPPHFLSPSKSGWHIFEWKETTVHLP